MKKIISRSEILGLINSADKELEVCATVEATFDETKSQLLVDLDSFLRPVDIRAKEAHIVAEWLPGKQSLKESTGPEEASDFARDIFERWVRRIREAVPLTLHPC